MGLSQFCENREFRGADGLTIRGDVTGVIGAPTVVLLHGGGQTRHSWREAAREFAECGYYVVALDARGHGDSDWSPQGAYSLDALAADLSEVLAGLGGQVALVGASMGGATALVLAAASTRIKALVMVDIVPRVERAGAERILTFMRAHPHGFATLDEAADAVTAYYPHRPRPRDTSGLVPNLRRRSDGRLHWHWDPLLLAAGIADVPGFTEQLLASCRRIQIPILLIRGLRSDIVSDIGVAELRSAIPHLAVFEVADAAHMVAGDRNDVFNAAVLAFLRRHLPPA
jgi:pimeloyl-ACP methyl ester carboxylesterase